MSGRRRLRLRHVLLVGNDMRHPLLVLLHLRVRVPAFKSVLTYLSCTHMSLHDGARSARGLYRCDGSHLPNGFIIDYLSKVDGVISELVGLIPLCLWPKYKLKLIFLDALKYLLLPFELSSASYLVSTNSQGSTSSDRTFCHDTLYLLEGRL